MINQSGIKRETATTESSILFAVEHQVSVGAQLSFNQAGFETDRGTYVLDAGTLVCGNISNNSTLTAHTSVPTTETPVGILLQRVEGDNNNAVVNATVLLFGFVNANRVENRTRGLLENNTIKEKLKMITVVSRN